SQAPSSSVPSPSRIAPRWQEGRGAVKPGSPRRLAWDRTGAKMSAVLTLASYLAENARDVHEAIAAYLATRLAEPAGPLAGVEWPERLRLLDAGRVDVGFLCGWPYAQRADKPDPPIQLLAAPVMAAARYGGRPVYFTDVVVRRDSPARTFADLRGRSYAYNEPGSHSGYNVPRDHLLGLGEARGDFARVAEA